MDGNSNGPRARPSAVAQSAPQQSLVRKACTLNVHDGKLGFGRLKTPRGAISTTSIAGYVPDHGEPCPISYRATSKTPWLFGDIARAHAALDDERTVGRDLPRLLCNTTPTRGPTAMIVSREGAMP
ncbi:MAG: hypothetical protein ACK47C_02330 [Paracoccaceae bacterium]